MNPIRWISEPAYSRLETVAMGVFLLIPVNFGWLGFVVGCVMLIAVAILNEAMWKSKLGGDGK